MAQESSTTAVFRALVMLACLIAIPLTAIFGGSLPEMLRELLGAGSSVQSASGAGGGGEAPLFEPIQATDPAAVAPPPAAAAGQIGWDRQAKPVPDGDKNVIPANYEAAWTPAMPAGDRFVRIQDRLRQLGATYYLLESWGSGLQLYRFYCKMAVGGNPDYAYYFEAVDIDRLRAMDRVLQQVEAWRAGQQ